MEGALLEGARKRRPALSALLLAHCLRTVLSSQTPVIGVREAGRWRPQPLQLGNAEGQGSAYHARSGIPSVLRLRGGCNNNSDPAITEALGTLEEGPDAGWADACRLVGRRNKCLPLLQAKMSPIVVIAVPDLVLGSEAKDREESVRPSCSNSTSRITSMHLGDARLVLLNHLLARAHRGRMRLRLHDTSEEDGKEDAGQEGWKDSVQRELNVLGVEAEAVTRASEHARELEVLCGRLLREGKAYIDNKGPGEDDTSVWEDMLQGTKSGCVRAKIPGDRAIFRTNGRKCYATREFARPILDVWEGATHALAKPDTCEEYVSVCRLAGLEPPQLIPCAGLELSYNSLNYSVLGTLVEKGCVDGWGDKRMPTVHGLGRRGLTLAGLRVFVLEIGLQQPKKAVDESVLWLANKQALMPTLARYTALHTQGLSRLIVGNYEDYRPTGGDHVVHVQASVEFPQAGSKTVTRSQQIFLDELDALSLAENDEVALVDWGLFRIRSVISEDEQGTHGQEGRSVEGIVVRADYYKEFDRHKTYKSSSWLPASKSARLRLTPLELHFERRVVTGSVVTEDTLAESCRAYSHQCAQAIGEEAIGNLPVGTLLQLDGRGMFIVDRPFNPQSSGPAVLVNVPSGHVVLRPPEEASD